MEKNLITEVGIKYRIIPTKKDEYILIPTDIIEGYSVGDIFYSEDVYNTLGNPLYLEEREYIIDNIRTIEELKINYDYSDPTFVVDYYFCEEQDYFIYARIIDNKVVSRKLSTKILQSKKAQETYEELQGNPSLLLNEDALTSLLNQDNLDDIKRELARYRHSLGYFKELTKTDAATKIIVENGGIKRIETNARIIEDVKPTVVKTKSHIAKSPSISVSGLVQYITERVFGHDDEIKLLATKIIMNYTSTPEFGTEPLLIAGPTGTGKTETIRAASEYLDIPFIEINTPNLVPEGIHGASLESYLNSLKIYCNGDLKQAEKSIVYLDEFDKLGRNDLNIKTAVKQILLKFLEGGTFIISDRYNTYNFNTRMLNKICSGAFQELFEEHKAIGFETGAPKPMQFSRQKVVDADYYGKELITRIHSIIPYLPLTREEQKRVILESKISKYLQKKIRYQKQFNIELLLEDDFINGLIDKLSNSEQSMRDLNNNILEYLALPEYEILSNPHSYQRLTLTKDTLEDKKNFRLQ